MAITKCDGIVTANIAPDCAHDWVAGLLDTAIAWHYSDIVLVKHATNPSLIIGYTVRAGAKPFGIYADEKIPFADAAVTPNTEGVKNKCNKVFSFIVPTGSGKSSKEVVDPIIGTKEGFIVFARTKNKVADGSVVVFGSHTGLMPTDWNRNYTDPNLGAALKVTLTETGATSETVTFVGVEETPTYEGVMSEWDTMYALVTY